MDGGRLSNDFQCFSFPSQAEAFKKVELLKRIIHGSITCPLGSDATNIHTAHVAQIEFAVTGSSLLVRGLQKDSHLITIQTLGIPAPYHPGKVQELVSNAKQNKRFRLG